MGSMFSPDGGWMFLAIEDAGWTVSKWWKHYVLIKHSINEVVGHFGSRKELNSTSFQTTLSGRKFQTVVSQPASKRGKIKRASTNCRPRTLQNSFLYSSQNSIFHRKKCFQWKMENEPVKKQVYLVGSTKVKYCFLYKNEGKRTCSEQWRVSFYASWWNCSQKSHNGIQTNEKSKRTR